uniref:Uncharacterized protein n=1 Tax=Avena sativa TaxID=4498 RepID=A0ACD5UK48_AVESA
MDKAAASKSMVRSKVSMDPHILPPDILRDILSRLSLKEAVRMRGLSREWRRLGICHPDLVFTEDALFGMYTTWNTNLVPMATKFITIVDNVLRPLWSTSTTTTATVDNFVVRFGPGRHHAHHIDRWVAFCVVSMAKHIGLDLTGWNDFQDDDKCVVPLCKLSGAGWNGSQDDDKYVFPLRKLSGPKGSHVNSLDMASVSLKLPPSFSGITNLKKLSLRMVSIAASDLQSLLLSCALLESLSLEHCPLSSFSMCHELCQLQYLRVHECGAGMIQLQAPNLTAFEFDDTLTKIVLNESVKLSKTAFVFKHSWYECRCDEFDYIVNVLPTVVPYVHTLFLNLVVDNKFQANRFSKTHATFINLRHLNLNIDNIVSPRNTTRWVTGLVDILKVAPLLQELELHIDCDKSDILARTVVKAVPGPLHHHLRSVHITGFCDFVGIAELALYILENSPMLERMVVDPVVWMDYGYRYTGQFYSVGRAELVRPRVSKDEMYGRIFARNHLDREEFRHILTIL